MGHHKTQRHPLSLKRKIDYIPSSALFFEVDMKVFFSWLGQLVFHLLGSHDVDDDDTTDDDEALF